jgi:hypothetical protein
MTTLKVENSMEQSVQQHQSIHSLKTLYLEVEPNQHGDKNV